MNLITEWLSEYKNIRTRNLAEKRFQRFLEWSKQSPEQLSKLSSKEAKHLILQFQNDMVQEGVKNNTILAYVSAVKLFFEYNEIMMKFRNGQLVKPQKDTSSHHFSNGDLLSIFNLANVQYKALIATASSTGWSLDDILSLDKERIKSEIASAKDEGRSFIFFEKLRRKTNSEALCCLNPLAIKWLDKWATQNKKNTLFNIRKDAVNYMVKTLAKRSGIIVKGNRVRFHRIRSWVINSLIKAGFSSEEWHYIVGKKIKLADSAYLNLKESVAQKYKESYERYLSITPVTTQTKNLQQALTQAERDLKQRDEKIKSLETRLEQLRQNLNHVTTNFEDRLNWLENRAKKKEKVKFEG